VIPFGDVSHPDASSNSQEVPDTRVDLLMGHRPGDCTKTMGHISLTPRSRALQLHMDWTRCGPRRPWSEPAMPQAAACAAHASAIASVLSSSLGTAASRICRVCGRRARIHLGAGALRPGSPLLGSVARFRTNPTLGSRMPGQGCPGARSGMCVVVCGNWPKRISGKGPPRLAATSGSLCSLF
jgi:hypothetical protein